MKEIELKEVNKLYKPDIVALEDFSLTIEAGEFVFVTGRSGSGKKYAFKSYKRTSLSYLRTDVGEGGGCVRFEEGTDSLLPKTVRHYADGFGIAKRADGEAEY